MFKLLVGGQDFKSIGNRYFVTVNVANKKTCWAAGIQTDSSMKIISSKTKQEIKETLLQDFSDFPKNFLDMVTNTNSENIYHGPLLVHEMPVAVDQGWGGSGRVALLGDSAHAFRPTTGNKFDDKIFSYIRLIKIPFIGILEKSTSCY